MSFVTSIILAVVLLVVSVILFFAGIVRRSLATFLLALLSFLSAAGVGAYGAFVLARKSIGLISFSRSGMQIYTAVFGRPSGNCTSVVHSTDQVLPRIDCCIWLEFKTCPRELARIASQGSYVFRQYPASDTLSYETMHSVEPSWWRPSLLGDTVNMLSDQNPEDPNHARFLLFSADSTHVFYCDFAE